MIDITGLDKAEVLAALHGASKAQGMGFLHDRGPLSVEECREIVGTVGTERSEAGVFASGGMYFDYLRGRVMKVDIGGDSFDPRLYDRDVGEGAAERAIAPLRQSVAA